MEITEYVTPIQKEILIEFIANHPNLNAVLDSRSFIRNMPKELWEEIAAKLNSSSGAVKTGEQWRKYVLKMKNKKKKTGITSIQKKILIEFIANHPNLNARRYSRSSYHDLPIMAKKLWKEIAAKLNSSPGAVKTWSQWYKTWLYRHDFEPKRDNESLSASISEESLPASFDIDECLNSILQDSEEEIEITPSNSIIETIATKTTQSLYESYSLQPETLAKQSEELTKIQTQYYKEKIKILREKQALDKDIKIRTVIALETIAKATKGK